MKLSIISFGSNSRIVAKFKTDRFRTFGENRAEKNKEITASKPYRSAAATLRSAVADGVKKCNGEDGGVTLSWCDELCQRTCCG